MKRINEKRVVPAVTIERIEHAVPVAEALIAGGLDIIEITLRTPVAEEAIRQIVKAFPEALVGAGTILTEEQVTATIDAGAQFGVAPGLNAAVVNKSKQAGMPFIPGVITPSEIEEALSLGCRLQKFFPAAPAGGVALLDAMSKPYAHTGIQFIPLGGISPANMCEYLKLSCVAAIGGSWIADKKLIAAEDFAAITKNAADAIATAQSAG